MDNIFEREAILRANRSFNLDDETVRRLLAMAEVFRGDEMLLRLAHEFHDLFFHSDTETFAAAGRFKIETEPLPPGRQAGLAALLMLSGLNHMEAFYHTRGIPEEILRDSLRDMTLWMDHHRACTGETGLTEVGWLLLSLRGLLFRLGRLEFMHKPLKEKICVARRLGGGASVAFFTEPECLRMDGQVNGTNGIFDGDCWQSAFEETAGEIKGSPIHPMGHAVQKVVRLPQAQWAIRLRCGDGTLDTHIPKDGRMDFELCHDSILSAMAFFPKYFPDMPFKALHLSSWLLDAQLQALLPKDSNIVRLQREFYLLPVLSTHNQAYERVFGDENADIANAPEDTALQKAVKRFVLAGHNMRFNAGVILAEDMARFGEAQYQEGAAKALEKMTEG